MFGITSNQAYRVTFGGDGENAAVVNVGKGDINMSITFAAAFVSGGAGGPVFRATDSGNYWCVDMDKMLRVSTSALAQPRASR